LSSVRPQVHSRLLFLTWQIVQVVELQNGVATTFRSLLCSRPSKINILRFQNCQTMKFSPFSLLQANRRVAPIQQKGVCDIRAFLAIQVGKCKCVRLALTRNSQIRGLNQEPKSTPESQKNTGLMCFFFSTATAEWRTKFAFHLYKQFKAHITRNFRVGGR